MAENKKSFLIYCDIIKTIDHLTDEEKGRLFQHLLEYVNDMNPILEDRVLLSSWKPIEQQLKRDLKKYESICERNRTNGSLGGRPKNNPSKPKKPSGNFGNPSKPKKADTDNDTDNDSDSDHTKFLQWFNIQRTKYLEITSNINSLSMYDKINLKNLKESYSNDDFNDAIYNLCNDKWACESNQVLPSHFLKPDNFVKYLNTEKKVMLNKRQRKNSGWNI